jgi:hypothetical protein|eukprot:SAG25_NODE_469_length_7669_cov_4.786262_6_plen_66_part_00
MRVAGSMYCYTPRVKTATANECENPDCRCSGSRAVSKRMTLLDTALVSRLASVLTLLATRELGEM